MAITSAVYHQQSQDTIRITIQLYKQRIVHEPLVEREVTRWSSHSEAMLQASLDDVDWDMFRASSSDVSEFTDVALCFVNTLTEQTTETVTIRTFSNQKPWVDR